MSPIRSQICAFTVLETLIQNKEVTHGHIPTQSCVPPYGFLGVDLIADADWHRDGELAQPLAQFSCFFRVPIAEGFTQRARKLLRFTASKGRETSRDLLSATCFSLIVFIAISAFSVMWCSVCSFCRSSAQTYTYSVAANETYDIYSGLSIDLTGQSWGWSKQQSHCHSLYNKISIINTATCKTLSFY